MCDNTHSCRTFAIMISERFSALRPTSNGIRRGTTCYTGGTRKRCGVGKLCDALHGDNFVCVPIGILRDNLHDARWVRRALEWQPVGVLILVDAVACGRLAWRTLLASRAGTSGKQQLRTTKCEMNRAMSFANL